MDGLDLQLSSKQLFKIIDNCWDSVLIIEKSSKIVYANNAFFMLIGYGKDKVIGAPFELFLKNKYQEPFETLVNKIQSNTVQSFINVVASTKDNHEVGLHIGMQPMEKDNLVVLNIKQTQEPLLREHSEELSGSKKEPIKKDTNSKEDDGFLGKTFGWLDDANKALDSIFHTEDKKKMKSKSKATKATSVKTSLSWLPKGIELIEREEIKELVKEDIDTFVSIDYSGYNQEQLIAAKEWHTWQVCIMLRLYKYGDRLFIADKDDAFPTCVKELSRHNQEQVIVNMIKNVKKRANIAAKKEILEKDAKWTAFEVACLFYFVLE